MSLSLDLISQFAKLSVGDKKTSNESTVYAEVNEVYNDGNVDICIDGCPIVGYKNDGTAIRQTTPAKYTSEVKKGDRVTVLIKNHSAIVTGNLGSPSASLDTVSGISGDISNLDTGVKSLLGDDLSGSSEGIICDINETLVNMDNGLSGASSDIDELSKGINLYLGTRNFDGDKWHNLEQWETWDKGSFEFKEYGRWGAGQGIFQSVKVKAGETYTFSFYAKGDENAVMNIYNDWGKTVSDPYSLDGIKPSTDNYTRYSFTFTALVDDCIYPRVENATEESWLQICGLKFEKRGPTDWSPAPEDVGRDVDTASKTATNYLGVSDDGVVVGDMTAGVLGKNVLIGADRVNIRDGEEDLASFKKDGTTFNKPATFTSDDGLLMNNGDAYAYVGRNNILWSGSKFMRDNQPITFKTNISRQLSGAIFVWSYYDYDNGTALDQDWIYFFVPKSHVINHGGSGVRMSDPYLGMMKYLYVSNGGATGVSDNRLSGTTNGIAWNNSNYVLRYVIGV